MSLRDRYGAGRVFPGCVDGGCESGCPPLLLVQQDSPKEQPNQPQAADG